MKEADRNEEGGQEGRKRKGMKEADRNEGRKLAGMKEGSWQE